ncbi:hypothetical protein KIL84_008833 [Mauremys mutica]|uniref:Uncharacterized protein n=1 Tax=Mauremys mutica TaxID=74926 RepID=A0A9D3X8H0_9SAUR|nr:hypothetical protein KIL84_008833 [Mauremys mutica]
MNFRVSQKTWVLHVHRRALVAEVTAEAIHFYSTPDPSEGWASVISSHSLRSLPKPTPLRLMPSLSPLPAALSRPMPLPSPPQSSFELSLGQALTPCTISAGFAFSNHVNC